MVVWALPLLLALSSVQAVQAAQPVAGAVRDANGGVLPGATVELFRVNASRPIGVLVTNAAGQFAFAAVEAGAYRVRVTFSGFNSSDTLVTVSNSPPSPLTIVLSLSPIQQQVTVQGTASPLQLAPTARTDVDRALIERLPSESVSSGLSSLVTLTSPGVAADSNGVFHPLGEGATFIVRPPAFR